MSGDVDPDSPLHSGASDGSAGTRLRAALQAAALPEAVHEAWSSRPPLPEPGQLWRARWQAATSIVLIVDSPMQAARAAAGGEHVVNIVPVSLDVTADDSAVTTEGAVSSLGLPLVLWLEDQNTVPVRVLDRYLGATVLDLHDLESLPHGAPVSTVFDERVLERARLQDAVDVFRSARWAPRGRGTLPQLLDAFDPRALQQALGLATGQVIQLRRGERALTQLEAQRLTSLTGLTAVQLLEANPALPDDLVAELDLPEHREQVIVLAAQRGVAEIEAWLAVGYAVSGVRERNTGAPTHWRDRLEEYFRTVIDDSAAPETSAVPDQGAATP